LPEDLDYSQERSEEASPERRQEFRGRGEIALSQELVSIGTFFGVVLFLSLFFHKMYHKIFIYLREHFQHFHIVSTQLSAQKTLFDHWLNFLEIALPIVSIAALTATGITLIQTKMNWSWYPLKPNFLRLHPRNYFQKIFSTQLIVNLGKSFGKLIIVGIITTSLYLGEWKTFTSLSTIPLEGSLHYLMNTIKLLLWFVTVLMFAIAAIDYLYTYFQLEKKLKMTKQEVKEEFKRREVNPHVKGRIKQLQREFAYRKTIDRTKQATVLVTNPTHYSIAIFYELGMHAPKIYAKGQDFLALKMRTTAKTHEIPIIEDKSLVRNMYDKVNVGDEVPEKFYKVIAEIIRYVFKLKNKSLDLNKNTS